MLTLEDDPHWDARIAGDMLAAVWADLAPPPHLDIGDWAETERELSEEETAIPGRFSLDATPVLRGKDSLWRSGDLGDTFTRVHNLGQDPTGTHHPGTWLLNNGVRVGKINGQPATVLVSYVTGTPIDADPPTAGSFAYIAYSIDQCQTWQFLNVWNYDFLNNTGVGQRAFRHFHAVAYDQWRDCWWFGTGDVDAHSAVWRWDGHTMAPIGSATPASVAEGNHPGWDCRYGSQRWRTVDILVSRDWIETFTDTVSNNTGGIWRVRPDFTDSHRVNHDTNNIQHDGCISDTSNESRSLSNRGSVNSLK